MIQTRVTNIAHMLLIMKLTKIKGLEYCNQLTGLAFMLLKAGTTSTVTAKNVKVSNPRSLITSTALATSSDAYI